ncbi:hypothetical protein RDI58_004018 [Solanum bulbocastanum]|uniref:Polyprotein n=1 Tax=Solanum bulbocastanum TaxID=147425 RepID=A0AAN8YL48_SOLBU
MKALLNAKMSEDSSVREHVLKMMSLLNELEILGVVIDKEYQVEMVLQTLPESFHQICLNYNMNKMDLSLAKLQNELQAVETIIKQQDPLMEFMVDKPSYSNLRGGQKKKKPRKVQAPRVAHGVNGGVAKPKGKCFHRKQPDHHKKQCPSYLTKVKKEGISYLNVIETILVVVSTQLWAIDLGATIYVCTSLQGFKKRGG